MRRFTQLMLLMVVAVSLWMLAEPWRFRADAQPPRPLLDPAAWGSDHVGQPVPEYIESGECLFCHRDSVGEGWARERHNLTIRDALPEEAALAALRNNAATQVIAGEVQLLLGGSRQTCFLKRSQSYGKLDLLSIRAEQGRGLRFRMTNNKPQWDDHTFADRCTGCHATGVDSSERTFSAISLDCYVCHGNAPLEHSNDTSLISLSKKRDDPPRVEISICGQCHLRGGASRSTGLPYPNNFVAGDNLFRDFQIDLAKADDPQLNPADRHVLANARDVALLGREELTCLSCHDVHRRSTFKHRAIADGAYCNICHEPDQPKSVVRRYQVHSEVCGY